MKKAGLLLLLYLFLLMAACQPAATAQPKGISTSVQPPVEMQVKEIPLAGPAANPNAELSGMAWYADWLVLLPQYPHRFSSGTDGALLAIPKVEILAFLDGRSNLPLTPRLVPLTAPGIRELPGFEGFEAIAFEGNSLYLTIEASPGSMLAYLVKGEVTGDLASIRLDTQTVSKITPRLNMANMSDEALLILGDQIATFDEANGAGLNPAPMAHLFNADLGFAGDSTLPSIEYRITDATALDGQNRFWVMNYFFPGDTQLAVTSDPLFQKYGRGRTHSQSTPVERLVELQWSQDHFSLVDRAPIQLQLIEHNTARNWEGLVRLDDLGFLAATDSFPNTILGFIAIP